MSSIHYAATTNTVPTFGYAMTCVAFAKTSLNAFREYIIKRFISISTFIMLNIECLNEIYLPGHIKGL